jgi:hypothetical protein
MWRQYIRVCRDAVNVDYDGAVPVTFPELASAVRGNECDLTSAELVTLWHQTMQVCSEYTYLLNIANRHQLHTDRAIPYFRLIDCIQIRVAGVAGIRADFILSDILYGW